MCIRDSTKIVIFSLLWLCAYPSCVEVTVFERRVVYSKCRVIISQWRSLCGRSCVYIVVILLCEGGDVEQWLEPRNIYCCLNLIHYLSTLSILYLAWLYIAHIHILDIVCVCPHLCWTKRPSYSTSTFNLEESRGVVSEPFMGNSGSLLVTHSVLHLSIKFRIIFPRLASTPIHPPLGVFHTFHKEIWGSMPHDENTQPRSRRR